VAGLHALSYGEAAALAKKLAAFGRILLTANETTNLVGATSLGELVVAHFLDSLAVARLVRLKPPVIDLGSGGGLPGIPIALAYPGLSIVLFEPRAKRVAFLRSAVQGLGIENAQVEQITAESAGRGSWRERAGTVLARALSKPRVALELGLPLVRRAGQLALYVGKAAAPDAGEAAVAKLLGGELAKALPVEVPYLNHARHVWVFTKTGETPAGFPRRSGTPKKEPIGLR